MTIVWYHGEFTDRIFLLKPSVDKNLWIRTISRGENWREVWIRHCRRFPQHEHFSRSRPLHYFLRLFSSHVLLAVITLFLETLAFYHVNDVKIHTSEQQPKDLGSHFKNWPLDPPCGSKFILISILLNWGPPRLYFVFATPERRSFDTPAYREQCCWAPQRGSHCFYMSAYRDAMTKNIKTQILHKSYEKKYKTKDKKRAR